MKSIFKAALLFIFLGNATRTNAQANDFRIGLYPRLSNMLRHKNNLAVTNVPYQSNGSVCDTVPLIYNPATGLYCPTSSSLQYSSDGFNTMIRYAPGDWWMGERAVASIVKMDQNCGLKEVLYFNHFFIPSSTTYSVGTPEYNCYDDNVSAAPWSGLGTDNSANDIWAGCKARPNYNSIIKNVSSRSDLISSIWGYNIFGEFNYLHDMNSGSGDACSGNGNLNREIPPKNISDALGHFRGVVADAHGNYNETVPAVHKLILDFAWHGAAITDAGDDFENTCTGGPPCTWSSFENLNTDFDHFNYLTTSNQPDVYFEESYSIFQQNWINQPYVNMTHTGGPLLTGNVIDPTKDNTHYLSKFANIDYLRSKGKDVHATIYFDVRDDATNTGEYRYGYHSYPTMLNGNWLWFQAYNSIIHGAKGVWFYADEWYTNSEKTTGGLKDQLEDVNPVNPSAHLDRYNGSAKFPSHYVNYVSNLSRELAYLVKNNFLSTDPASILYSKTTGADPNCNILPSVGTKSSGYIRDGFYNASPSPYNFGSAWVSANSGTNGILEDKCTENYGLRYTIRTNGSEVVMIVSNPLNVPVGVTMDFSNVSNPIIRNSTGVDVLFENTVYQTLASFYTGSNYLNYKTANKTYNGEGINLGVTPATTTMFATLNYTGNKQLSLVFGPMDVHILKFRATAGFQVSGYDNGWNKEWSNDGNNNLGGWGINDNDRFVAGNFYNAGGGVDNGQELLCLSLVGGTWSTLLKFDPNNTGDKNWAWIWSNYGNSSPSGTGWNINSFDKYIAGDFDGDGVDELLCTQLLASGAKSVLLKFNYNTNSWTTLWTNLSGGTGNGMLTGWTIGTANKFIPGDFDYPTPDSKKELFVVNKVNSGIWAVLRYNTSTVAWDWIMGGGTNPNQFMNGATSLWTNDANSDYEISDYNTLNGNNEIFCYKRGGTNSLAKVIRYESGLFQETWTNGGATNVSGWASPLASSDVVLPGNVDADGKHELMFISNCSTCEYSQTSHLNASNQLSWGWGNHWAYYSTTAYKYIDDWFLADPTAVNSRYLLIKPFVAGPNYLLATRKYGCKYLASMYKTNGNPSGVDYKIAQPKEQSTISTQQAQNEFLVYPNPSTDVFIVSTFSGKKYALQVMDLMGKIIFQKENISERQTQFNLAEHPSGVYLVKIQTENWIGVKRIIKN